MPAGLLNTLAALISELGQGTKTRLAVGGCLTTLTKYNLLKGSIAGDGVYMHE